MNIQTTKHQILAVVEENQILSQAIFKLIISAPQIAANAQPGQFVHILPVDNDYGLLLRRPISIARIDRKAETLDLIIKKNGIGTDLFSRLGVGELLSVVGPLGHGWPNLKISKSVALVAGGIGMAPLMSLAATLNPEEIDIKFFYGGRTMADLVETPVLQKLTNDLFASTEDGSVGAKGFITDQLTLALRHWHPDLILTCGPEAMMKKVYTIAHDQKIRTYVSLEQRMGCGIGACLGCAVELADGTMERVCTEGPVFEGERVFSSTKD